MHIKDTEEKRVCPKCGKIHHVDYATIDWQKNFAAETCWWYNK